MAGVYVVMHYEFADCVLNKYFLDRVFHIVDFLLYALVLKCH